MAVVGDLELVVATKGQLRKSLVDSGLWSDEAASEEIGRIWEKLGDLGLLQSVRVKVELAVAVDFEEGT